MAREFKLLFALWLVVACLGGPTSGMTLPPTPTPTSAGTTTPTPTPTSAGTTTPTPTPTSAGTTTPTPTPTSAGPTTPTPTPTSAGPTTPTPTPTSAGPTTPTPTPTSAGPTTPTPTPTSAGPTTPTPTPTSAGPTTPTPTPTSAGPTTPTPTPTSAGPTTPTPTPTSAGPTTPSATPTSGVTTPVTPGGPSTTLTPATTTTTLPPTTKLPGPCDGKPCRDRSTCEPRSDQNFVCLCLAGDNYDYEKDKCVSAKIFPGLLQLPDLEYDESMSDKTSPVFQEASLNITKLLDTAFNTSGGGSEVVELSKLDSKVWSRSTVPGVRATVNIIFRADADIDTAAVEEIMTKAKDCVGCLMENAIFTKTDLCKKNPCDVTTTNCSSVDGLISCTCLTDYIGTNHSNIMCIACPSGKQTEDSKICVPCSFGYSGLNCNESWKRTLVIVGSVLGGLLLITLILLPVLALKSSKKSSKKDTHADMGKPYVSHPPAKQPLANSNFAKSPAASFNGQANGLSAFANAGVPRIPRATTTNSWDSRTNLEMNLSNSRQNLIPVGGNSRSYDDHDDMNRYAQVRPQSGLNAQARPQYNPYAQNQPQTNPYAQSQGNSNPYYMHDNGRRLN